MDAVTCVFLTTLVLCRLGLNAGGGKDAKVKSKFSTMCFETKGRKMSRKVSQTMPYIVSLTPNETLVFPCGALTKNPRPRHESSPATPLDVASSPSPMHARTPSNVTDNHPNFGLLGQGIHQLTGRRLK